MSDVKNLSRAAYDSVADLYDDVFQTMKIRKKEWRWLLKMIPPRPLRILDIGCGNGMLLEEIASKVDLVSGTGVDVSEELLQKAKQKENKDNRFRFEKIEGTSLPFKVAQFDLVISFLSFRYLDWEPMLQEILRVLDADGKFIMIDMAKARPRPLQYPQMFFHLFSNLVSRLLHPRFSRALKRLVHSQGWKEMLTRHPIKELKEYQLFLQKSDLSFHMDIIDISRKATVIGCVIEKKPQKHDEY